MWWILVALGALTFIYWLLMRPYKYWVEKGVQQGSPVPIFGDNLGTLLRTQSFAEMIQMIYNSCPNTRYSGFYQFMTPTLLLRDHELIKQITVKDFDHFVDHRSFIPEDVDPLWAKNLVSLTGKTWREMRSTLSPAFTSSKMKFMFSLISQNSQQFVKYFLNKGEDIITIEMKDTFTRFTNDVIASTAFGVECDSLSDRSNEFYLMGKEATNFSGFWKNLKFFLCFTAPRLAKFFRFSMFSREVGIFFKRVIKNNIDSREKHGIVRPDMIHLLLEAKKHGLNHDEQSLPDTGFATVEESEIGKNTKRTKIEITETDITAQALVFFFAGFDSVSSLMCFMSHELGVNLDIQEKLIEKVDNTLEACKGNLTYEALLSMKYLDMVVSETLRKWPNAVGTDRVCTKPYTIEPKLPDEMPVHLKINDLVSLPIFGIHHDPKYYPEPERFDPERFNDENKKNINPYTYLPFGSGPRNCIGSRFALLETKTLFFHILSHFQIVPVEKTSIPLVISRKQINMTAENGFWLGLKRRTSPRSVHDS